MNALTLSDAQALIRNPPKVTAADVAEPETDAQTFKRLAELSPVDYDRCRGEEAKRLKVRTSTLDDKVAALRPREESDTRQGSAMDFEKPQPWSATVNGAELLDDLRRTVNRYSALPDGADVAVCLWIVHAWTHEASFVSPILAITSPLMRCGKTTVLTLLGSLVRRPLTASHITPSALFRSVEKWAPTLLIDEADSFLRDNEELRGVLNSGHSKPNAFVIRTSGEDFEPRRFSTWAPKAIALIGKLPGTLADRSIHISMRRKLAAETVEPIRLDRINGATADLCRRCARWGADNVADLRRADPDMPRDMNDRGADNWRCLLAIAERAGGAWPTLARDAIRRLADPEDEAASAGTMLLGDIQSIMGEHPRIASSDLVEKLIKREDRPWPEWRHGKPITSRQIARLLEPFGIKPRTIRINGSRTAKGYEAKELSDSFVRYLYPPDRSVTPSQMSPDAACSDIRSVTLDEPVTDRKARKPLQHNDCYGVTDRKPLNGAVGEETGENDPDGPPADPHAEAESDWAESL